MHSAHIPFPSIPHHYEVHMPSIINKKSPPLPPGLCFFSGRLALHPHHTHNPSKSTDQQLLPSTHHIRIRQGEKNHRIGKLGGRVVLQFVEEMAMINSLLESINFIRPVKRVFFRMEEAEVLMGILQEERKKNTHRVHHE
jgi:hypothetical protein